MRDRWHAHQSVSGVASAGWWARREGRFCPPLLYPDRRPHPEEPRLGAASRRMAANPGLGAILRDASLRDAPQTVCPFAKRRRLTLDASARVTRIGRAEPH